MKFLWFLFFVLICSVVLSRCTTVPENRDGPPSNAASIDLNAIPNAKPRELPKCKYGNMNSYVVFGKRYYVMKSSRGYDKKGIASWYGTKFHKRKTSCGEPYNMYAMTAASKTLPLPTFVKVTNLENGRQIIVKVNDRGPFADNRIMDLSYVAAAKLGMIKKGTALVRVTAINPRNYGRHRLKPIDHWVEHHSKPRIYLQLGAFKHHSNARELVYRVRKLGYDAFISTREHHFKNTYRVRIGPIRSVDEADRMSQNLERRGYGKPLEIVD